MKINAKIKETKANKRKRKTPLKAAKAILFRENRFARVSRPNPEKKRNNNRLIAMFHTQHFKNTPNGHID